MLLGSQLILYEKHGVDVMTVELTEANMALEFGGSGRESSIVSEAMYSEPRVLGIAVCVGRMHILIMPLPKQHLDERTIDGSFTKHPNDSHVPAGLTLEQLALECGSNTVTPKQP